MKVNQLIRVIATGEILKITRIDNHVYPICAGYRRFTYNQIAPLAQLVEQLPCKEKVVSSIPTAGTTLF